MAAPLLLGACASTANDLDAPLQAISMTDTAVETTVQAAQQAAETAAGATGSFANFSAADGGGVNLTSGSSTASGVVSYAVTAGGDGVVLVAWNKADRHCIGSLVVANSLPVSVLGESAKNTYDFIAPATTSAECTAATYAAEPSAPTGWPVEPSSSPWPVP